MYKFISSDSRAVVRVATSRCIYLDQPATIHSEAYLQWVADGGVTEPYVPPVVVPPTPEQIQAMIVTATQQRLDDFAKTRNYDGILSACTYAPSLIDRFRTDGVYCVGARDNTWAALYAFMADVQAGTKPMPTSFADVEPLLPVLSWPV